MDAWTDCCRPLAGSGGTTCRRRFATESTDSVPAVGSRSSRKPKDLGDLRRTTPFTTWGAERGGSVPRAYIGEFLGQHEADIRGRVLEIASDRYARSFAANVDQVDILDVREDNEQATFIANLADAPEIPDNTFDCVLVTQVLSWIYDVHGALRTAHRFLAPGGVMLATTPGIASHCAGRMELFGEWWHFTSMSAKRVDGGDLRRRGTSRYRRSATCSPRQGPSSVWAATISHQRSWRSTTLLLSWSSRSALSSAPDPSDSWKIPPRASRRVAPHLDDGVFSLGATIAHAHAGREHGSRC